MESVKVMSTSALGQSAFAELSSSVILSVTGLFSREQIRGRGSIVFIRQGTAMVLSRMES